MIWRREHRQMQTKEVLDESRAELYRYAAFIQATEK